MKKVIAIAIVMLTVAVLPTQGQLRFGVEVGANMSNLSADIREFEFDESTLTNFTGGVKLEWIISRGVGFDVGAYYLAKGTEYKINGAGNFPDQFTTTLMKNTAHYVEVPVNLKYKLCIPAIEHIFIPYVYAGPSFAFKVAESTKSGSDNNSLVEVKNSKVDYALNLGLGMEFIEHLNVRVQYGWGLDKTADLTIFDRVINEVSFKSGTWSVAVGWMF